MARTNFLGHCVFGRQLDWFLEYDSELFSCVCHLVSRDTAVVHSKVDQRPPLRCCARSPLHHLPDHDSGRNVLHR